MSTITKKLKNLKDYRSTVDPKVKDEIIVEYAPLIKYIAQKIASRLPANIELDDLISCGVIGLMDAIKKFDPTRDNKFKTYAEFRIRGAILDELRAQDWVPRSVREKAKTVERAFQNWKKIWDVQLQMKR
ncbi:MAG: sigma-70 family RNA polymerase sigma factor [Bacteriovoracaceae bacterium]